MNIYILLILTIISYFLIENENKIIKKELYNKQLINYIKDVDIKLDYISKTYNCAKMHEFSLKLSNNNVHNQRYAYGIGITENGPTKFNKIKKELYNKLNIQKEFIDIINKYQKKNSKLEIVAFGVSKDNNDETERVYIENNNIIYKPAIVSYEMTKDKKIYIRYYVYKKINDYLYEELNKLGYFGKIFIKYFPKYKIKNDGFKYSTTKEKKIIAFRIFIKEYNSIDDIKYFIFDIANYFNMDNKNMIEIKKWIHHFRYNELNILGITLYPKKSITLYSNEYTEYD